MNMNEHMVFFFFTAQNLNTPKGIENLDILYINLISRVKVWMKAKVTLSSRRDFVFRIRE